MHKAVTVTVASFRTWRGWPHVPLPLPNYQLHSSNRTIMCQDKSWAKLDATRARLRNGRLPPTKTAI